MPIRVSSLFLAVACCLLSGAARSTDRRIVDTVQAGDALSEARHGFAGSETTAGVLEGRAFRQARGWMRYAVTVFDDTEVTIALTFAGPDSVARQYDVLVEDSLVATRTRAARSSAVAEVDVPFAVTRGRVNIAVMIRARDGLTPAVHELRTIQDHNELDFPGTGRQQAASRMHPQAPTGVTR